MTAVITDAAEARLEQEIGALAIAADAAAHAANRCAELEDQRALIKADAIKRLMEAGLATSASAAEKIVERDTGYMEHRAAQRAAELARWRCLATYHACQARVRLATGGF